MAWQFPLTKSVVGGVAVDLGNSDSVFVANGVVVASTSIGIIGTGSDQQAVIAGTVAGSGGIYLSGNAAIGHDERVTVGSGAEVRGFQHAGVWMAGYHSEILNDGLIY